jgi:hypothetical protein
VAIAVLLAALALAATLSYANDVRANTAVVALAGVAAIGLGGYLPTLIVPVLHRALSRRASAEFAGAERFPPDEPRPLQRP